MCKSQNLCYCITCKGCGKNYIGQTGNKLCERARIHKQQIRDPSTRNCPCSEHIEMAIFLFFPFYKILNLENLKSIYINIFNPSLNKQ